MSVLLILAGLQSAAAQDRSRYRVEIIVLNHLQHDVQPDEVTRLQDYSAALDFLAPAAGDGDEAGDEAVGQGGDENRGAGQESGPAEVDGELAADSEPAIDPEPAVEHLPDMGPEMKEAWRRLRLSGPFRPLQFLAWEQRGDAPFPVLRLHDFEVVHSEDPWSELRDMPGSVAAPPLSAETEAAGESGVEGAAVGALPPPVHFYRLDGSVSLSRGRFLRLALSLELREPVSAEAAGRAATPPVFGAAAPVASPAFRVHRLEQTRSVRTGRMEYFDGPVLGVLAWITNVSDRIAEEQAATAGEQP